MADKVKEPQTQETENTEKKECGKERKKNKEKHLEQETPVTAEQEEKIAELEKKTEELNDRFLRTLAEYDNFRKRSQREKEAIYPDAVAQTVAKFLPVLDNFERALQIETSDAEFKKGVEMIYNGYKEVLNSLNVVEAGAVGETFDPNLHNAVMHVEDEQYGENQVVEVFQKGYKIGDRVIRFAVVKVAN